MITASLHTTFTLCLCNRLKDTVLLLLLLLFREDAKRTLQEVNKLKTSALASKGDCRLKWKVNKQDQWTEAVHSHFVHDRL